MFVACAVERRGRAVWRRRRAHWAHVSVGPGRPRSAHWTHVSVITTMPGGKRRAADAVALPPDFLATVKRERVVCERGRARGCTYGKYLLPCAALPARCSNARHSLHGHGLAQAPLALPRRAPVLQEGRGMRSSCAGGGGGGGGGGGSGGAERERERRAQPGTGAVHSCRSQCSSFGSWCQVAVPPWSWGPRGQLW